MKSKIDEILDQLLEEIKKGRSIEDCLKKYPEIVDELEPLLRLAHKIEDLPKPEPEPEAVKVTVIKMRKMMAAEQHPEKRFSFRKIFTFKPVMVRAIAVILLIIFIGWTSLSLSANTVPGDFLYPVKLLGEKVHYILTINPEGKAELHLVFADKRTKEFVMSFEQGIRINRELLSTMLSETDSALKYSESLGADRSTKFIMKVKKCNQIQMEVLQEIKPLVLSSDSLIINEAINLCIERCHCVDSRINSDPNIELHPCPCQDK